MDNEKKFGWYDRYRVIIEKNSKKEEKKLQENLNEDLNFNDLFV
jgi:hypothetical protein